MPKNPPPSCPKCQKPMHFVRVKTGGRKFRCIDCDKQDPLALPEGNGQKIISVSGVSTPLCVAELAVSVEPDSPSPFIERKHLRTTLPRAQGALPMTGKMPTEQKWHEQSEQAKREAANLPAGREREGLLRRARQLEMACHINDWISSPGLRRPT